MSSPAEENRQSTSPGHGSKQKPIANYGEYFRFRAITFAKDVITYANHYKTSEGRRDYVIDPVRRFCWSAASNIFVNIAVALLASGAVGYWLYINERLDPQWIMAIFTVALTATAVVQWWTSHHQWLAMRDQLEHMRLEQRAWIAILECTLKKLVAGKYLDVTLHIHNSGHTPGRITSGAILAHFAGPSETPDEIAEYFETHFVPLYDEFIVTPGKTVEVSVSDLGPPSEIEIESINAGRAILHILCRFSYIDVMEREHTAKAFYTLSIEDRGLYMQKNYGSMD